MKGYLLNPIVAHQQVRDSVERVLRVGGEGDERTFTRVDRVCLKSLDLQLLVKDLCDRGIRFTANEQPFSKKDTTSKCFLDMLGVFT